MPDQYLAREECCRHSGQQRPQQYEIMAQKMKEAGYTTRTAAVVQNKVKALRQAYIQAKVKIYVSLSVIRPVLE